MMTAMPCYDGTTVITTIEYMSSANLGKFFALYHHSLVANSADMHIQ